MPRKKATNPEELLACPIRTRVTRQVFNKLEKIKKNSDCHSIGEVARKILSREKITCFYRDISLTGPMEELALIRKELKAIGININQQTHRFHMSSSPAERAYFAGKTADLYQQVGGKVDDLLSITSKLAEKWLPRSSAEKA